MFEFGSRQPPAEPTPTEALLVWCEEKIRELAPLASDEALAVLSKQKKAARPPTTTVPKSGFGSFGGARQSSEPAVKVPVSELGRVLTKAASQKAATEAWLHATYPQVMAEAWQKAVELGAPHDLVRALDPKNDRSIQAAVEHLGQLAAWCRNPTAMQLPVVTDGQSLLGSSQHSRQLGTQFIQEITMGDKYEAGQALVQGGKNHNIHAHDITFNQVWQQHKEALDLRTLGEELQSLRNALTKQASDPEHYVEIGAISTAELEAKKNDGPKALEALSKVGSWGLGVAEKIGIGVATAAIKTAIGF